MYHGGKDMKRMLLVAAILSTTTAFAEQFLVKYKDVKTFKQLTSSKLMSAQAGDMLILSHHKKGQYLKIDIEPTRKVTVLAELLSNKGIEYVIPNFKLRAFSAPVEISALKQQWAMTKINAEQAWVKAGNKGSKNVVVAVIDTGVDYNHKNLKPNMIPGYNFAQNTNDPMDKVSSQNPGHGTHCAGVIGATGLIDGGIVGMSPEISIMPIKFLGEDGSGDLDSAIKSVDYAIDKKVAVISASWGATVPRAQAQPLLEAVKRANDAGVIFIAAAANDGRNNDTTDVFPANANYENTITVSASGNNDEKPSWSNYGQANVHLAAPGLNIMSTVPKDGYSNMSGTSMATPLVSGVVAFLKSQDPSLTGAEVRALLQTTGAKAKIQTACNCRIDAAAATDVLLNKKMWLVPAAGTLVKGDAMVLQVKNGQPPFRFTSSQPAISVDASGIITAQSEGSSVITVTDATGKSVSSLEFYVGKQSSSNNPGNPGDPGDPGDPGNPGTPGECPLGDQALCDILCQLVPDMPFCK